jgi:hypothetical protein
MRKLIAKSDSEIGRVNEPFQYSTIMLDSVHVHLWSVDIYDSCVKVSDGKVKIQQRRFEGRR